MALLLAALGSAGCLTRTAPAGLPVAATIYPLVEFARGVGGPRVSVRALIPAGAEAHDYEPTPGDAAAAARSRLFIYNGAGFEPWAARLIAQLPEATLRLDATAGLPLVSAGGRPDPHVWLDPLLARQQVDLIRAALARVDPGGEEAYAAGAARLAAALAELDAAFRQGLAPCRGKEFITAHAAFGYLARRYDLHVTAISGLAPEAEPSPARIKGIIEQARRAGVRVVFVEPRGEWRVAETIAREVGGQTAVLDPLETLSAAAQRAGKNYFTVMHENLEQLARGLDCH